MTRLGARAAALAEVLRVALEQVGELPDPEERATIVRAAWAHLMQLSPESPVPLTWGAPTETITDPRQEPAG